MSGPPAVDEAWAAAQVARLLGWRGTATRLSGGLLNHVFRVSGPDGSVVLKHAPPHVASAPELALDPARATFEARALAACDGRPAEGLRSPRLLAHDGATLVMEDVGELPDLVTAGAPGLDVLARALRQLHGRADAPVLHNRGVQETRLAVQYQGVGGWLAAAGVTDAATLGARATDLGRRLLAPGPVWIQGDLWPPSVRVGPDRFVLIDWEFSTTGHRCQDVGHLAAHLWMQGHQGPLPPGLHGRFVAAYGAMGEEEARDTAVHFACEILARTVGAFGGGFLYEGAEAARAEAVAVAADALRAGRLPG